MVELGDSVTTVDDNGDAALHGAVMRGSPELVLYLLERGAALDPVNQRGWTPLTIAQGIFYANLGRRWPDMEALLLGLGATLAHGLPSPRGRGTILSRTWERRRNGRAGENREGRSA